MSGKSSLFSELSQQEGGTITLGDKKKCNIIGIGKVGTHSQDYISDVLKEMFKNEGSYLSEIKLLKNQVLEQTKENFELICKNKELEISQTKSDKDFKALETNFKALKTQVTKVISENSLLSNKFVSLKHQYGELEK